MAAVTAEAMIRADNRRLAGDLSKSKRLFSRAFRGIGGGIKRALSGALSPLGVGLGVSGLAILGKEVLGFEEKLTDLEIQGKLSGDAMSKLRGTIKELSAANAQSSTSLADAALALTALLGPSGASAENLRLVSNASLAANAPVEDLAGLIFTLQKQMDVTDPKQLEFALSAIIKAGEDGAVPLNELNQVLQSNAATFKRFAASGVAGTADLTSALQFLRTGFGGASEAGTGLEALMNTLISREVELGKAGIKVRDQAGNLRPLLDIVENIDKVGIINNPTKFNNAFGKRVEARKALELLKDNIGQIKEMSEAARKGNAVEENAAKRRASQAFKIRKTLNDVKERLLEAFTPERIEKFVALVEKLVGVLLKMIDHAEIFIGIFVAAKLGGFAMQLNGMASSLGTMAGTAAGVGTSIGTWATGLGAAAAAGFAVGTALDRVFGFSDKFANIQEDALQRRTDVSGLKFQSRPGAFETARIAAGERDPGSVVEGRARGVLMAGRETGITGPGGEIPSEFELEQKLMQRGFINPGEIGDLVDEIRASLITAQAVEKGRAAREALTVNVNVTMDKNGALRAEQGKTAALRAAPAQ
jgi:hypothetical protein